MKGPWREKSVLNGEKRVRIQHASSFSYPLCRSKEHRASTVLLHSSRSWASRYISWHPEPAVSTAVLVRMTSPSVSADMHYQPTATQNSNLCTSFIEVLTTYILGPIHNTPETFENASLIHG